VATSSSESLRLVLCSSNSRSVAIIGKSSRITKHEVLVVAGFAVCLSVDNGKVSGENFPRVDYLCAMRSLRCNVPLAQDNDLKKFSLEKFSRVTCASRFESRLRIPRGNLEDIIVLKRKM